jgi:hypothetical protein
MPKGPAPGSSARARCEKPRPHVDNYPLVLAHARALLTSSPAGRAAYIPADLQDPGSILTTAQPFRSELLRRGGAQADNALSHAV